MIRVGPAKSDSFGIGVGLSEEEPMAGAVSLRVRETIGDVIGLEDFVGGLLCKSSRKVEESGMGSSLELIALSGATGTGACSAVT